MQGKRSGPRSAVRSGVLTGISTAAVSGSAGIAGAILSRKFGHGSTTDGFFAAYAVYLVLLLVASSLRVVVLPELARAQAAGELGREVGSWALALAVPLVPVAAAAILAPHWVAGLLTSNARARTSAAELLPWLVPAAAAQIYAGLGASALAALDDYGTAALAFAIGAAVGVGVIGSLVEPRRHCLRLGARRERGALGGDPARRDDRPSGGGAAGWGARPALARARGRDRASARTPGPLPGRLPVRERPRLRRPDDLLVRVSDRRTARRRDGDLGGARLVGPARAGRADPGAHRPAHRQCLVALPRDRRGRGRVLRARRASGSSGSRSALITAAARAPSSAGWSTYLAPWMVASIALSVAFPLLFVRGRARWLPAARASGALGGAHARGVGGAGGSGSPGSRPGWR